MYTRAPSVIPTKDSSCFLHSFHSRWFPNASYGIYKEPITDAGLKLQRLLTALRCEI